MPQGTSSIVMLLVMGVLMYFLMIRPQKKRQEQEKQMRSSLKVGDRVVTIGGIRGRVTEVRDDSFEIETGSDHMRMEFLSQALSYIVRPAAGTSYEKEEEKAVEPQDDNSVDVDVEADVDVDTDK